MRDTASINEIYCPQCGYDLRAIESARCPECGLEVDRSTLGESIIPWLHREKIGRYRAFWRTVNLATFRPKKLAREMNCPARFEDAVKFRRMVVLHAWIPLAAIQTFGAIALLSANHGPWVWTDPLGSILQIALFAFWLICLWFYLLAIGGVASYFFHPKSLNIIRQNRAVALSYYACAPMAYTFLTLALLGTTDAWLLFLGRNPPLLLDAFIFLVALAPTGIQFVSLIRVPILILKITTHCERDRQVALGIFLPTAAMVLGFLLLVVIPIGAMGIALMILSLHR